MTPVRRHRVVVLLLAPVVGFDATIAPLVFGEARDRDGSPLYEVVTCSLGGGPVTTTSGYGIVPAGDLDELTTADTVVVPGTRYPPARERGTLDPEVAAALDSVPSTARWVSICTGAFVLAASGRLDDLPATTHWRAAAEFRALFPQVRLDEAVLFVDGGDGESRSTGPFSSAGLSAGIDLCLHLLRLDHGAALANSVARYCVVPPVREGGQAQFISHAVVDRPDDSTAPTRAWALDHLVEDLSIRRLAAHAHMSTRTFSRRFRAETGVSPGEWVRNRRVDRAREMLEAGGATVDEVAARSGLGSADNLRHHLRTGIGMSPTAYRKAFSQVTASG
ncbi:GlxA family transcriptional regulator [Williamsia serinedens]|uniref:Transcriptional regulator GlxA family, contains an amidase domain and an AraC-type DNA-binding HTH domain n=1 Tax=Williamsia serinedens TaxID=391736 RepID=A0ABT1H0E9_9NOCA|nr:helix-turn-helix domain-containing protein [Williamsia serinedens]MCP2160464.1 Transcriptional regulator GlxA family, contains an amidase domain and an AraC-type DNA-binding HTH domain [Williamsia serinedens]